MGEGAGCVASSIDPGMIDFMSRLKAFRNGRVSELRYDTFARRFIDFRKMMQRQRMAARRTNRTTASDFNIFALLGLQNFEVTTHSAFLGNLLSPHGTHAQEELFFKTFLETLVPPGQRAIFDVQGPGDYEVTLEKPTDSGFIDIFIESRQRGHQFAIVIENKVLASDQPQQLARYYDYITAQRGHTDDHVLIVYLTPGGWAPTEQSLKPYNRAHWLGTKLLIEISYWEHVKLWLEQSIAKVKAPAVKVVLKQYIQTIEQVGKE